MYVCISRSRTVRNYAINMLLVLCFILEAARQPNSTEYHVCICMRPCKWLLFCAHSHWRLWDEPKVGWHAGIGVTAWDVGKCASVCLSSLPFWRLVFVFLHFCCMFDSMHLDFGLSSFLLENIYSSIVHI